MVQKPSHKHLMWIGGVLEADLFCVGGNLRELGIEVGESAFELFAIAGALAALELLFDARA